MRSVLPFDEINRLCESIRERLKQGKAIDREDIIDEMFDLFLLTYANANLVTGESLSYEYKPLLAEVMEVIDREVAGKTWRERTEEYLDDAGAGKAADKNAKSKTSQTAAISARNGESAEDIYGKVAEDIRGKVAEDIVRIIETETHRIANESAMNTAGKAGATKKRWVTMMDDKVRDTHSPLEGVTVPYDADFYTFDGDHARAPGLFALPENNINCRCELRFEK